jgi:hypothetical protein
MKYQDAYVLVYATFRRQGISYHPYVELCNLSKGIPVIKQSNYIKFRTATLESSALVTTAVIAFGHY